MEIKRIIINKNRGWRGLAELKCYDSEHNNVKTVIFSFSQPMWEDLHKGLIVIQDDENYYILDFDNLSALPTGQRSVLIKTFNANVLHVFTLSKTNWATKGEYRHTHAIYNFINNKNNHTTSDWNCIRNKSSTYDISAMHKQMFV